MDTGRKRLERTRYHQVGKGIEYNININPLLRFPSKVLLQLLANSIALPDIRFQVNAFLRIINGLQHRGKEIAPISIQLKIIIANPHFTQQQVWKTNLVLVSSP